MSDKTESVTTENTTSALSHLAFCALVALGLARQDGIAGTPYAGPASKPEGLAELKKAVAGQPHDRDIVIYCGCCPMEKCPNIRPAFAALREMGFTRVRVLSLPENLKTDWIDHGYPTDQRSQ